MKHSKISLVNELVLWMFYFRLLYQISLAMQFFLSHMQIKLNILVLSYRDPYLRSAGGRQKTLVVL